MISGRWFGTSRHLKSIGMRLSELLLGLMGKKNSDHIITKHFSNWPVLKVIATLLYLYSLSIPTSQFFFIIMVMLRIQLAKYWKDWHLITNSHHIMLTEQSHEAKPYISERPQLGYEDRVYSKEKHPNVQGYYCWRCKMQRIPK